MGGGVSAGPGFTLPLPPLEGGFESLLYGLDIILLSSSSTASIMKWMMDLQRLKQTPSLSVTLIEPNATSYFPA